MSDGLSRGTVIFPIADGVEDLEYWVTRMRLEEEGYRVRSVGLAKENIVGKNGLVIPVEELISEISSRDVVGIVLAGGWAPDKLRRYSAIIDLIAEVNAQGKIIGTICHGGLLAISAKIVAGKKATGSLGIKDDLINAGATWVDESAFTEGNLVWGRVVADIPNFCRELVAALAKRGN
jgi:protease I